MYMKRGKVENLIRKRLEETIKNCAFKQAWIPAGWACVNIGVFAKEMAGILDTVKGEEVIVKD